MEMVHEKRQLENALRTFAEKKGLFLGSYSLVGPIMSHLPNFVTRLLTVTFLSINMQLPDSRDKFSLQSLHRDVFCDDIS